MISLEEVKNILNFIGYGRLDALLWFLGFEESLGKRYKAEHWSYEWELRMRAAWFPEMDMRAAHKMLEDPYWELGEFSYMWVVMAQLAVGILEKASDWGDSDRVNQYVQNALGRSTGDTPSGKLCCYQNATVEIGLIRIYIPAVRITNRLYCHVELTSGRG
jgi:hypothetical protein